MRIDISDDKILVQQCLSGSEEAWAVFQHRYTGLIFSIAKWKKWRFSHQETEDVCEDVYVKLIESGLNKFNFESSLKNYIAVITQRVCADRFRGKSMRFREQMPLEDYMVSGTSELVIEEYIDVLEVTLRKELAEEFRLIFLKLGLECQKMLRLRFRENKDYSDICGYMNIGNQSTLRTKISRCITRLSELAAPVFK